MQKGFIPSLLLIILLVIAAFGGTAYYFRKPIIEKFSKSQVSKPSELKGFPVYPKAIFVKSGMNQECNQKQQINGLKTCTNKYYQWVTKDNFDQVRDWYAGATQKSGWKCNSGAGQYTSVRDASIFGNKCIKEGLDPYELSYDANSESTQITLEILKESPNSDQSNETANWQIFSSKYGYSFRYPNEFQIKDFTDSDLSSLKETINIRQTNNSKTNNWITVWDNLGIKVNDLATRKQWCDRLEPQLIGQMECSHGDIFSVIDVNGYRAYQTKGGRDASMVRVIYIPYGDYVYEISLSDGDPEKLELQELNSQLLSTFKFLP